MGSTSAGDDGAGWEAADRLFDAALDLPKDERDAFLDRECGDDRALRALVGRLLAAAESEDTLLAGVAAPMPAPAAGELARDLAERMLAATGAGLGTGFAAAGDAVPPTSPPAPASAATGWSASWAAAAWRWSTSPSAPDGEFHQQVALKLIRRAASTPARRSSAASSRSARSSPALAHPGIARLLDGGAAGGRPPLPGDGARRGASRSTATATSERLSVDRAAAALPAASPGRCEYAHRNLVVHRDLKPSNILVTADGARQAPRLRHRQAPRPRTAGEPVPLTRTMARLMTPAYASPEQVRGEPVTTASDVYQLGLLLYVLLTGRFPYPLEGRPAPEVGARDLRAAAGAAEHRGGDRAGAGAGRRPRRPRPTR